MSLIPLDYRSSEAIYSQIRRVLEQDIRSNWKPGDRLPPETLLAERFSVNRHTLRRAVDALVQRGLVVRRHGRGVYVLEPPVPYSISKEAHFTVNIEQMSKHASVRLLHRQVIEARDEQTTMLQLNDEEKVIWIETLRVVDSRPFSAISHFLPHARFARVAEEYGGDSLHGFIREHYGFQPKKKGGWITAAMPMGDDSVQLQMPDHEPLLRVRTLNVDPRDGTPVEYAISRFRSSRVELEVRF